MRIVQRDNDSNMSLTFAFILSLVFTITSVAETLVISEFMAANDSTIQDENGEYSDWVEFFNYGNKSIELSEYFLTDDAQDLKRMQLPQHKLEVGEFHVVWLSGDKDSLGLSVKGEYLALVSGASNKVIQDFGKKFPSQNRDISYGLVDGWSPNLPPLLASDFLLTPTPGKPNSEKLEGIVKKVRFNTERGFFEKPFNLKMETKTSDVEIRYTLDGTIPTQESGHIYSEPISVDQTSVIRATAFKKGYRSPAPSSVTYIFPKDVIKQSQDGLPPVGWPYMWGENQVDYGMDPEVVNDPQFAGQFSEAFKAIPTISLVLNNADLFDEESGIYSNAQGDGREWERPCSVEFIHPSAQSGDFQIDAGLRIRGGFSRMGLNPKHAFRLFFRDFYGPSKLKAHLFPDKLAKEFDNIDLRTFQNYSWSYQRDPRATFLRDQFNRDLQLAMGQPAARGEYYHLYLNGQYWGIFNTCERPKAAYGETYLGGKKEDYDAVKKGNSPGTRLNVMATDGNLDAWRALWETAKNGLESNESYFKLLGQNPDGSPNPEYPVLLDPENLIDYMLVIFYGGNLDAPVTLFGRNRASNNWHSLRNRNLDARQGFQFFVWDAEHTFLDVNEDRTGPYPAGEEYGSSNPQYIWQQCLDNAEFRQLVADKINERFYNGGVLDSKSVQKRFKERASQIENAIICESARWGDVIDFFPGRNVPERVGPERVFTLRDWKKEIGRLVNEYIPARSEIVVAQLYSHGLWPDIPAPKASQSNNSSKAQLNFDDQFVKENKGTILYTVNGKDPRLVGGAISPYAQKFSEPVSIENASSILARTLVDGEWSPLTKFQINGK